jgi:diadenosine tetraphosphate (Ap4A) HIT family hydrolase
MAYDPNNIFAKILRGEIPAKKLFEDDRVLAFHDIRPAAPVHVLVIPKRACVSLSDFASAASADEIGHFFKVVADVAREMGIAETGYRILANAGADSHQEVPHFHVHILGGRKLGPLLAQRHD